ncbi:outer membrane beta-barrel protein [Chryseobacterium angstadtii]|uniref:outer membrane beta-barrel protein n=1 Tax=Chryseobacterium angstadtii TaxID=558151 RepID=UPI00065AD3B9|nr:outer membrane beta-barrel protein [Chryseobacterium angstadtii]
MNNRWLNDLHRKMEDHEEDVPDGLWDDIKNELFSEDEEKGMAGVVMTEAADHTENRAISAERKSLWFRVGGIAAGLALLFFTGKIMFDMNAEKSGTPIVKETEKPTSIKATEKNRTEHEEIVAVSDPIDKNGDEKYSSSENIRTGKTSIDAFFKNILGKTIDNDNQGILESVGKEKKLDLIKKKNPILSISPFNIEKLKEKENSEEIINPEETKLPEKYADNTRSKHQKRTAEKWMLSMLTGNFSSGSSEQKLPGYASISGTPMAFSDVWSAGTTDDPLTAVLLANQSKEVEARIRHKIPVTFGLSMYYSLGKRWGIGTGVNYTKLTSELHSGSNSDYIKGDQSVHYIGIPVQINYNVVQKGRFTGYVTGGVLAEKAVAAKLKTTYIVNNEIQDTQEERLDTKPVQVSLNTALGLQVKVVDKIGIYAEPGIGYHFKNDSQLNTIYKEKPLNFNMKFGIRLLLD